MKSTSPSLVHLFFSCTIYYLYTKNLSPSFYCSYFHSSIFELSHHIKKLIKIENIFTTNSVCFLMFVNIADTYILERSIPLTFVLHIHHSRQPHPRSCLASLSSLTSSLLSSRTWRRCRWGPTRSPLAWSRTSGMSGSNISNRKGSKWKVGAWCPALQFLPRWKGRK